jgi:hypothetical protein
MNFHPSSTSASFFRSTVCCRYKEFMDDLRSQFERYSLSEKKPWKLLKHAGGMSLSSSRIPTLRTPSGANAVSNSEKAKALNDFYHAKLCNSSRAPVGTSDYDANVFSDPWFDTSVKQIDPFFSADVVAREFLALDMAKASGPNLIPPRVYRSCAWVLARPFAAVFNNVIASGVWPDRWKKSLITPVAKKKFLNLPRGYRPVSLIDVASRVLESLLASSIRSHLLSTGFYLPEQFAYRPHVGVNDLTFSLLYEIVCCQNAGGKYTLLQADFEGAFDSVWHPLVVSKLTAAGVSSKVIAAVGGFLSHRLIATAVNGSRSNWSSLLDSSLPQGSGLGPILWVVMLMDFISTVKDELGDRVQLFIFADDVNIGGDDAAAVDRAYVLLDEWAMKNRLRLENTKLIRSTFSNRCRGGDSSSTKIAGLLLDSELRFDGMVRESSAKAGVALSRLLRVKRLVGSSKLRAIFNCTVLPYLERGTFAVNCFASDASKIVLDKVANRFCRYTGITLNHSLQHRRDVAFACWIYRTVALGQGSSIVRQQLLGKQPPSTLRRSARVSRHPYQLYGAQKNSFDKSSYRLLANRLEWFNDLPAKLFAGKPSLQSFKLSLNSFLACNN